MQTIATVAPPERSARSLPLWTVVGSAGSVGMVLTGSTIGSVPHPVADHWWFTVPTGAGIGAHLAFYASVALLVGGWAGIGIHAYRGGLTVPVAWVVLAAWAVPLLLGTPLFSRDLYSYVAQGSWPGSDSIRTTCRPRLSGRARCCRRWPRCGSTRCRPMGRCSWR